MLVRGGCHSDPGDEVIAGYEAPYPNAASKAAARAFPQLVPQAPDAPGAAAGEREVRALREDRRPTLMLWGDSDPVLPPAVGERFASSIGRPPPRLIEGSGHFLQEDRGPALGALIAEWLACGARRIAAGSGAAHVRSCSSARSARALDPDSSPGSLADARSS